jgi:hypothetical protein
VTRDSSITTIWVEHLVLLATFALGMVIAVRFFRWEARGN